MVIDCHAHLDSRVLDVKTLLRKMDEHGIDRVVLMARITETVEPAKSAFLLAGQRLMMNSSVSRPLAAAASRTFYDSEGRLRTLWRPFTAGGRGYTKVVRPDNESVASALVQEPDRLWGWIFVNPNDHMDPVDEVERWRSIKGMMGIKAHPYWHQYSLTKLSAVCRRAEELHFPLLIHLGFGVQGQFKWLLERFPRLKVIFAHAGIPYFNALWPLVRENSNAFIDLSSPHLSESLVRKAVASVGARKCLYGTDSPYGFSCDDGSYDYARIKGWIERLRVTESERDLIFSKNFLGILSA